MRRKGERPLPVHVNTWEPGNALARAITQGDSWFRVWQSNRCTPDYRLEQLTGIPKLRLATIRSGAIPTRAEIDALACAWTISSGDLICSMGGVPRAIEEEPYVVEMAALGLLVDNVRSGRTPAEYVEAGSRRIVITHVKSTESTEGNGHGHE